MTALYCIVQNLTVTTSSESTPIKDKNGEILTEANEQHMQWIEHFKETLNQPDPTVTHNFSMDHSPKELTLNLNQIKYETWDAIKAWKNNKTADLDQITIELLKCGEDTVVVELTNLMNRGCPR